MTTTKNKRGARRKFDPLVRFLTKDDVSSIWGGIYPLWISFILDVGSVLTVGFLGWGCLYLIFKTFS